MSQTSFKQAYSTLQQHAETLRHQQEPNIDDLLTIVSQSVQAYNVCKQRIDAVEKAMEQALSGAAVGDSAPESEASRPQAAPFPTSESETNPFEHIDPDVPF